MTDRSPDRAVPAVAGIVLAGEDVLLVRDAYRDAWTLPMGRLDPGERIDECVRREVLEEAAVVVSPDRVAGVYSDPATQVSEHRSGEVVHFVTTAVVCSVDEDDPDPSGDGVETTDAAFFPGDESPAMAPLDRWVRDALDEAGPVIA